MKNRLLSVWNRVTLISVAGLSVLLGVAYWQVGQARTAVDQAVRQNFVAAGLLSRLQVEGERMRRYEKEMFIYVAVPDKRAGYVKEFREAYDKALAVLDTMLAPSGPYFTDADRQKIAQWKAASAFYYGEFDRLAVRAEGMSFATMTPEQRAGLTVQYNDGIKAGKDRFRDLLNGTATMRGEKEASSQRIAGEIDGIFNRMIQVLVLVAVGLAIGIAITGASRRAVSRGGFAATRSSANSSLMQGNTSLLDADTPPAGLRAGG